MRDIGGNSTKNKGDVSFDEVAENIHPNSRKVKQVTRAIAREEKTQTRKRNQKARVKPKSKLCHFGYFYF